MTRFVIHAGEALNVLRTLPDGSVDAVITDPPYSSGGLHSGSRKQTPNKKYTQSQVKNLRPEFSGDNRDQRSFS